MGFYAIPEVLEAKLGKDGAGALAEMLHRIMEDEKRDMLARVDEKVAGRYSDIHRRMHEDVAGVEIRLGNRIAEVEAHLNERITQVEARLNERITQVEARLNERMTRLEERMSGFEVRISERLADFKLSILRWMVGLMVVQAGLLLVLSWVSRKL